MRCLDKSPHNSNMTLSNSSLMHVGEGIFVQEHVLDMMVHFNLAEVNVAIIDKFS